MTSQLSLRDVKEDVEAEDEDSEAESVEQYEFDVYEREGYDKIMRTVAYGNDDDDEFARQICDVLEVFESLCPGRYGLWLLACNDVACVLIRYAFLSCIQRTRWLHGVLSKDVESIWQSPLPVVRSALCPRKCPSHGGERHACRATLV